LTARCRVERGVEADQLERARRERAEVADVIT
jgi:hypothetical protein